MEFNSKDEECEFWKERSLSFQNELLIVQEEFHSYEMSSKELEQELELQLDDYESKNRTLGILNEKLSVEYENIRINSIEQSKLTNKQFIDLQEELVRVKSDKVTLQKYIRELEQTNDDLDRSQRATVASLQDFEYKLNIALEKNAILENELDEKEALVETVQRLKDEARDMRQDLQLKDLHMTQIQRNMSQGDKDALASSLIEEKNEPLSSHSTIAIQTDFSSQVLQDPFYVYNKSFSSQLSLHKGSNLANTPMQIPLTPAARISALNLVSDMLRKVGAIELKLSSAAKRGLQENDISYTNHGPRVTTHHRMSESAVFNKGYSQPLNGDSFDMTPLSSPIHLLNSFDESARQMSQTVGE